MRYLTLVALTLVSSVTLTAGAAGVVTEQVNFTGLSYGADEQRVSALKEVLRTIPETVSAGCVNLGTANTKYGPTTQACVEAFQSMNGLKVTGAVNEETNRALNAVLGEKLSMMPVAKSMAVLPVSNSRPLVRESTTDTIESLKVMLEKLQEQLNSLR